MAERVVSQHAGADEVIAALREVAARIKGLGHESLRLEAEREHALQALQDLHAERSAEERASDVLSEWSDLLRDFRLGIRDRDELIENTVGRYG